MPEQPPLLEVANLAVRFALPKAWPWSAPRWFHAVRGIDLTINAGEVVAVVGESGCGKSTLARSIARLIPAWQGQISLDGTSLDGLSGESLRHARRPLQMVFQDPASSLDPRWTAAAIIAEPLIHFELEPDPNMRQARIATLLSQVGLDPALATRYPHELSGGQRQRLAIARALAAEPRLLLCDEPVSALDVSVQAQVVNLLGHLRDHLDLGILFIAHDLAVVRHLADRVLVVYAGRVVESGTTQQVFEQPLHPYTKALLSAVPIPDPASEQARASRPSLAGEAGSPPAHGCRFAPRCPLAQAGCRQSEPELASHPSGQASACPVATATAAAPEA